MLSKASKLGQAGQNSHQRGHSTLRWGSTPTSVMRSASISTIPRAIECAISDVDSFQKSAPFVVSTFKQATRNWDEALAATADPFSYLNARTPSVTNSPMATKRSECDVSQGPTSSAIDEIKDEARRLL
jgi:hypothetical protein